MHGVRGKEKKRSPREYRKNENKLVHTKAIITYGREAEAKQSCRNKKNDPIKLVIIHNHATERRNVHLAD